MRTDLARLLRELTARQWLALAIGAMIAGGAIAQGGLDAGALALCGGGIGAFGCLWFWQGPELSAWVQGRAPDECLHWTRIFGDGETCAACDRGEAYQREAIAAIIFWIGLSVSGLGAAWIIMLRVADAF